MVERQLGVGVIGCGNIANKQHLPNYARNPRGRIVAVADVDQERARATAERWSVDAYYVDYRDMLARADVQAVSVTTWPGAHVEPVIATAKAGKHIMCEKPLAPTLEDADAMVAAAEQAGVKFSVGYQTRFSNGRLTVKKLLDEGVIGRLQSINVVSCAPSAHYTPWFLRKAEAGGGVLMDWGSCTAYMINWLMGPVESVYGAYARFVRTRTPVGCWCRTPTSRTPWPRRCGFAVGPWVPGTPPGQRSRATATRRLTARMAQS